MSVSSGRRNETARSRHRNDLKSQYSLTSVPRSELELAGDVSKVGKIYNLNNHFGWTILRKSYVSDSYFPNMSQYYQKPDVPTGGEDQRVTYVLVMDKGTVVDSGKANAPKETQTVISGVQVEDHGMQYPARRVTYPEEDGKKVPHVEKKRKSSTTKRSTSCFGGGRRRSSQDSRSSKSSKGSRSSEKGKKGKKDHKDKKEKKEKRHSKDKKDKSDKKGRRSKSSESSQQSDASDLEGEAARLAKEHLNKGKKEAEHTAKKKAEKYRKKRSGPDRWQLRAPAGAEKVDEGECDEKEKVRVLHLRKSISKTSGGLKITSVFEKKPVERLMETPSGLNKYLFLGRSASLNRKK